MGERGNYRPKASLFLYKISNYLSKLPTKPPIGFLFITSAMCAEQSLAESPCPLAGAFASGAFG